MNQGFDKCTYCKLKDVICRTCHECDNGSLFEKFETKAEKKKREEQEQKERLANLKVIPKYGKGQEVYIVEGNVINKYTIRDLVINENGDYRYKIRNKQNTWDEENLYGNIEDAIKKKMELLKHYLSQELSYVKSVMEKHELTGTELFKSLPDLSN